ncbi:MAG: rod shape-determining protein MreC [Bacteroidota bacterium]
MRNIINFIQKQYFFFIFLLLEIIAFILIFQNHFYHRTFFVNSANTIAGNIYESYSGAIDYFHLKKINKQLMKENTALRHYSRNSFLINDRHVFHFQDTLYQKQYTYINARVISNSVYNRSNNITLNKGSNHGIEPDMGIITHNGVIGIVLNVSDNFSSAMSLLHPGMKVSVRHKKNRNLGTLFWEGYNYKKATLTHIPPHVKLNIGDTIVTSGYSHIFPENINIGTVSDFEVNKGDNFYTIEVDLFTDFNKIEYVNVVKNLFYEELKEVEDPVLFENPQ